MTVEFEDQGSGEVHVKKTGERLGTYSYELVLFRDDDRGVADSVLLIDLDPRTARRCHRFRETLVLRIRDGRHIDFYVNSVDGEAIGVKPIGALYLKDGVQ